jgi:glycosyltransferase involved in cell wall biosynthesis
MTRRSDDVSLIWLLPSGVDSFADQAAVGASCSDVAEAIIVGASPLMAAPDARVGVFAHQTTIVCDSTVEFAAALNRAAAVARGPYLLVITQDVSAEPGWLDALREPFETDPATGVTTPRLITEDGLVAAAGSVVWSDGTCERYGVGQPHGSSDCCFRRRVAAVPPHCLLLRASSLAAVGGFHTGYQSPEYVLADLCFSFHAAGLRAVYQPRATVRIRASGVECEGMAADRARLRARWPGQLGELPERRSSATSPRVRFLARDALARERILVVDDRVVGPDRGSGDPRMFTMLQEMVTLWPALRVTLAAMTDLGAAENAPRLQERGIEVAYGESWCSWFQNRLCHYGVVIMSRPQPAIVDEWIRATQPQAFRIYDAEALAYRRLERRLPHVEPSKRLALVDEIRATRAREVEYLATADEILCVTREEQRVARALAAQGTPVFVLPFCVDIASSPPGFAERRNLVYFGGFMAGPGSPNEDAVLHLAGEILPLIRQRIPDVVLHVVGADPTPAVLALESAHVHVVGYVRDPRTWLDRARVHLVPMRFGAGLKQKLIDTMAAGLPFVATPVAAEGLRLGSLARLAVADTPAGLAELTLALYMDEDRWKAAHQQILCLATRHGRPRFRRVLATALSRAGIAPPQLVTDPSAIRTSPTTA